MNKREEAKKEMEILINWLYKASFTEIFNYNKLTQERSLSGKTEEKVDKIINKYIL